MVGLFYRAGDLLGLSALMVSECGRRLPGYQPALQGSLRILLASVWRALGPGGGEDPSWLRLVPALQRMYEAGGAGIGLAEVAAGAGWSAAHFSRVFRRALGQSVQQFLRRLRVHRAATLLLTTGDRVEAVAASAGYSDGRALRRAFSACYGTTPAAYRRVARG